MNAKPVYALDLLEMRRFGDRRPRNNQVVITDDRMVSALCRQKLGWFVLLVEPFLPYNLGLCYDLDVVVIMNGGCDRVLAGLRRGKPRSLRRDDRGEVFWLWVEWLVEVQAGHAPPSILEWHTARQAAGPPRQRAA